jgi:hypothetical protein
LRGGDAKEMLTARQRRFAARPQADELRRALLRGRANHRLALDNTKIQEAGTRARSADAKAGLAAESPTKPSGREPDLPAQPKPTMDRASRQAAAAALAAAQAARGR